MMPSTTAFETAVRGSAQLAARVVISLAGEILDDTFYTQDHLMLISAGSSIDYDRGRESRGTATLTFHDMSGMGAEILDPLVYAELRPYLGVMVNGDWEWIAMGVYSVEGNVTTISGTHSMHGVQCTDRSTRIRNNPWGAPWQVAANSDYFTQAKLLLVDRAKGFTPEFNFPAPTPGLVTPAGMIFSEEDDPWASALKLVESEGAELYLGRNGEFKAVRTEDPLTVQPALSLGSSDYNILLTETSRQVTNREVYNGVICRGEAPWLLFPIKGEVWDDDPLSKTYRGGPFGEKPLKIGDSLATTNAQCQQIAQAKFNQIRGVTEDVDFGSLRDPRLEEGDSIELFLNVAHGSGYYTVDKIRYELASGKMTGMLRRRS